MKIIRFNAVTNALKLEPHTFDDLYLLAMVISKGDKVEARSTRRFRGNERDTGEQKDVTVMIDVEKNEIDKNASRLRLTGKILSGHPEEFVNLGSYHTLNIGPEDIIDIRKEEWKDYIIRRIREAVAESRKPKLAIVAVDDEKATAAYVKGYGIDIITEIYSHLSKRMKEKDYAKQRESYFNEILKIIENMKVDIVVIAGPGFTKDDIKRYISEKGIPVTKKLAYAPASDAERSGIREVTQSETVAKMMESEHVKREFGYLNAFLGELRRGRAIHGTKNVSTAIDEGKVDVVMINDSVINQEEMKKVLDAADKKKVKIEIFNSEDDAGAQLRGFGNIAGMAQAA